MDAQGTEDAPVRTPTQNQETLAESMKAITRPVRDNAECGTEGSRGKTYWCSDKCSRLSRHVDASAQPKREPDCARAGDVVSCLVCSGKGYIFSLRHVVCRECKGTRTVTIEVYK